MSKEVKQPNAESVTSKPVVSASAEPRFTLEKLRENCNQLFGVTDSTFAGASAGLNGEFTVNEMKSIISVWLKKEAR